MKKIKRKRKKRKNFLSFLRPRKPKSSEDLRRYRDFYESYGEFSGWGTFWKPREKIKCYLLTLTDQVRCSMRRVADPELTVECTGESWHIASVAENVPANKSGDPKPSDQWPTVCKCGYHFSDSDDWELIYRPLYIRSDTGELITLAEATPGAIWQEDNDYIVRTPGGDLNLSSRAGNCSMPFDNEHKCWIIHGEVPEITVDKKGHSCDAGGGSIIMGDWHGFLRKGYLE